MVLVRADCSHWLQIKAHMKDMKEDEEHEEELWLNSLIQS
jgi:hypothetical protein